MDDAAVRAYALNTHKSFIVQAPAGSGKTELLTQRILALLATVDSVPEAVLAVTFTRKAAAEMRARLVQALARAALPPPTEAFARCTWDLARKLYLRDQAEGWHLLENPQRFSVMTIDALSMYLVAQLPLLSGFGAAPKIAEDPAPYYAEAVARLSTRLQMHDAAFVPLRRLWLHCDNRLEVVERLLCALLACRDQWLPYMVQVRTGYVVREILEGILANIVEVALTDLHAAWPSNLDQLRTLCAFAATQMGESGLDWVDAPLGRDHWHFIADMLLTQTGSVRKTLTKLQGFPTATIAPDKAVFAQQKAQALEILAQLSAAPACQKLLAQVRALPAIHYSDKAWDLIAALTEILPELVAELSVVFKDAGVVDFLAVSLAALGALGEEESPTDLALKLDYRIAHLLVDELQDTSQVQLQLFEKLLHGWAYTPEKTVFLVGDPMQSIYRFRGAEVGLFLRIQQQGLAGIALESLYLQKNFRSDPALIAWSNQTFAQLFPSQADMGVGAVPHHPASPSLPPKVGAGLCFHRIEGDQSVEAALILEKVLAYHRTHPTASVAILVRSRKQAQPILSVLRKAAVDFQSYDMEPLAGKAWILALLHLTRALLFLDDRIAWLALLRGPLVGLGLPDLYILGKAPFEGTILEALQSPERGQSVSPEAKARLAVVVPLLLHWVSQSRRFALAAWVRGLWDALGGQDLFPSQAQHDVAVFFEALSKVEQGGDIPDFRLLETCLAQAYSQSIAITKPWLEVMTIHKAKGLEFDMVVIPGLAQTPRATDVPLMVWHARTHLQGCDWIIGASPSVQGENDSIYQFIQDQEKHSSTLEQVRLLYVAVTRAKSHLLLTATIAPESIVRKNAFLGLLEPYLALTPFDWPAAASTEAPRGLRRITRAHQQLCSAPVRFGQAKDNPFVFEPAHVRALRLTGTVLHQLLERAAQVPFTHWQPIQRFEEAWKGALAQAGVPVSLMGAMYSRLIQAMERILQCPRGRWILSAREQAVTEWSLAAFGRVFIVDRSFVEEGVRWIIDYKSTTDAELCPETLAAYKAQLDHYAKIIATFEKGPIRLGLYFPLRTEPWMEWAYTKTGA